MTLHVRASNLLQREINSIPVSNLADVKQKAMCVLRFQENKSVIAVQRYFSLEYRNQHVPSKDFITKLWYQQMKDTVTVRHRKCAGSPLTSDDVVDQLREAFTRRPIISTRRSSLQVVNTAINSYERYV